MADLEKITKKRLGELLVAEGMISQEQLSEALQMQEQTGELLGEALVRAGFTTETEIAKTLCVQFAKPFMKPSKYDVSKEIVGLIPAKMMAEHMFMPVDRFGNLLVIAMAGLLDAAAFAQIQSSTGCEIEVYITTASDLRVALRKAFPDLFDPITLQPKFEKFEMSAEVTAEMTAALDRALPDEDDDVERPTRTMEMRRRGDSGSVGETTREVHSMQAEEDSDWEALFEEAEQNVMQSLHAADEEATAEAARGGGDDDEEEKVEEEERAPTPPPKPKPRGRR